MRTRRTRSRRRKNGLFAASRSRRRTTVRRRRRARATVTLTNPVRRRRKRSTVRRRRRSRSSVMLANPVRRRRVRRSFRRRARAVGRLARRSIRRRSRGFSMGGGMGSLLSKENLTVAAGAVAGGMLTSFVLRQFGSLQAGPGGTFTAKPAGSFSLPGSNTQAGVVAYSVAIPLAGSFVARKLGQRAIAQGMAISGIVMGVNSLLAMLTAPKPAAAVQGASEYFTAPAPRALASATRQPVGDFASAVAPSAYGRNTFGKGR